MARNTPRKRCVWGPPLWQLARHAPITRKTFLVRKLSRRTSSENKQAQLLVSFPVYDQNFKQLQTKIMLRFWRLHIKIRAQLTQQIALPHRRPAVLSAHGEELARFGLAKRSPSLIAMFDLLLMLPFLFSPEKMPLLGSNAPSFRCRESASLASRKIVLLVSMILEQYTDCFEHVHIRSPSIDMDPSWSRSRSTFERTWGQHEPGAVLVGRVGRRRNNGAANEQSVQNTVSCLHLRRNCNPKRLKLDKVQGSEIALDFREQLVLCTAHRVRPLGGPSHLVGMSWQVVGSLLLRGNMLLWLLVGSLC